MDDHGLLDDSIDMDSNGDRDKEASGGSKGKDKHKLVSLYIY